MDKITGAFSGAYNKVFSKKNERVYTADDEIRIVLLGKTGAGKSHTGNTIFGEERFESKCMASSVTKKCVTQAMVRKNKKVILIDTPGLFDSHLPLQETKEEVVKCVAISSPGVHCFLLILQIGRFSPEEKASIKHFLSMFGENAKKYIIILFSKTDTIGGKGSEQERFESYIKSVPEDLKSVIEMCENRYIGFNNNATDKKRKEQVNRLFDMINDMNTQNSGFCYTNEMYLETEKKIQEEIERRREHEAARLAKEREEEIRRMIEDMKEKHEKMKLELKLQKLKEENETNKRKEDERLRNQLRAEIQRNEAGIFTKLGRGIVDLLTLNWF